MVFFNLVVLLKVTHIVLCFPRKPFNNGNPDEIRSLNHLNKGIMEGR
jgi:hypothetical protein